MGTRELPREDLSRCEGTDRCSRCSCGGRSENRPRPCWYKVCRGLDRSGSPRRLCNGAWRKEASTRAEAQEQSIEQEEQRSIDGCELHDSAVAHSKNSSWTLLPAWHRDPGVGRFRTRVPRSVSPQRHDLGWILPARTSESQSFVCAGSSIRPSSSGAAGPTWWSCCHSPPAWPCHIACRARHYYLARGDRCHQWNSAARSARAWRRCRPIGPRDTCGSGARHRVGSCCVPSPL